MECSHGSSSIHFIQCMNVDHLQNSNRAQCRMMPAACCLPTTYHVPIHIWRFWTIWICRHVWAIRVKMANTLYSNRIDTNIQRCMLHVECWMAFKEWICNWNGNKDQMSVEHWTYCFLHVHNVECVKYHVNVYRWLCVPWTKPNAKRKLLVFSYR